MQCVDAFRWMLYEDVAPAALPGSGSSDDAADGHQQQRPYSLWVRESVVTSNAPSPSVPVVLVHGMVVAGDYLVQLGELLAPYYRVFIPDLPGCGRSSGSLPTDCLTIRQSAALLVGLLDVLDKGGYRESPAVFIGNSMGCQIIAELTYRFPDRVRASILQGPTKGSGRQSVFHQILLWLWNGRNERNAMMGIMLNNYWKAGIRTSLSVLGVTRRYNIEQIVPLIRPTIPLLIVNGELDPVSPMEWGQELTQLRKGGGVAIRQVLLLDSPHTANFTTPRPLAAACRHFLVLSDSNAMEGPKPLDELQVTCRDVVRYTFESCGLVVPHFLLFTVLSAFTVYVRFDVVVALMLLFVLCHTAWRTHNRKRLLSFARRHHAAVWPSARYPAAIPNVADFDSATAFLRATALMLHGDSFPHLGRQPLLWEHAVGWFLDAVPTSIRTALFSVTGALEAVPQGKAAQLIDSDQVARAVALQYPVNRKYPVIAIGSSNGALVHLYAALQIPWLPQTLLIAVRRTPPKKRRPRFPSLSRRQDALVYDLTAEMDWGRSVGEAVLAANPQLQLHHMADPNQDALMTRWMSYFRFKYRSLPDAYRRFIVDHLQPGGTVLIVDCQQKWKVVQLSDRHFFQLGAVGGLTADQYTKPNHVVDQFIRTEVLEQPTGQAKRDDELLHWNSPTATCETVEAEWGFEPSLAADVASFTAQHGFIVRRLTFQHPEDVSGLVADLYRQWYVRERQVDLMRHHQLFGETFILVEPWWTLRMGVVPYWVVFGIEDSRCNMEAELRRCRARGQPLHSASTTLFSHGIRSVGWASSERWQSLLSSPELVTRPLPLPRLLVGANAALFPANFQSVVHYHMKAATVSDERYPMPLQPLPFSVFDELINQGVELPADRKPSDGTRTAPQLT